MRDQIVERLNPDRSLLPGLRSRFFVAGRQLLALLRHGKLLKRRPLSTWKLLAAPAHLWRDSPRRDPEGRHGLAAKMMENYEGRHPGGTRWSGPGSRRNAGTGESVATVERITAAG